MLASQTLINDRKARFIGIPLIGFGANLAYDWHRFVQLDIDFLLGWFVAVLNTLFIWEGLRVLMRKLLRKYPHYEETKKRLLVQTVLAFTYAFFVTFLIDTFCSLIRPEYQKNSIWIAFIIGLFPTVIVTLIYESVYFFNAWKSGIQRVEALAKESVQSQLEALKSQLDPHFLFNSLNTLSFLIDEKNTEAQTYLEKLADVYRYVLVSKQKDVVSLQEEMEFVEAYMYLNKVRFRENIQIEKQLETGALEKKVAPLSLQMLIENAIKHNIISKDKPLKIQISANEKTLSVVNNLQEKITFEQSTKVGLQNIQNRYALLTNESIFIEKNQNTFKVELPLL